MDQQPFKTEAVTSVTSTLPCVQPDIEAMAMETLLLGADDITHQNQTAQLFIEALLQTSRSQLLTDCNVSDMNQIWSDSQVNMSHDSHMTDTSSMKYSAAPSVVTTSSVKMASLPIMMDSSGAKRSSVSHTVTGRDSFKMVSPQLPVPSVTIKQRDRFLGEPAAATGNMPVATAVSPKKRSRRQTTGTMDMMDDKNCSDAISRRQGFERSVSESSSETTATPRRKGSHQLDGGRRSRTQSESENDMFSDSVSMMNMYASDDTRRQMAGSVTPETDVGFQPSMLDAVLTEKKLALLRSPEIRQFLQQQQVQKAKERKLTHTSPTVGYKGDNSS